MCGLGFSKPDFIFHHKEHSQAHILLPSSWVYKGTLTVAGFYEIRILYIIWIILYINHIIHYMNYNSMNYFMQNLHWQPTKGCLLNFLWGALTLFWGCCFSSFLSGFFFFVLNYCSAAAQHLAKFAPTTALGTDQTQFNLSSVGYIHMIYNMYNITIFPKVKFHSF